MNAATVQLQGSVPATAQSDLTGQYSFTGVGSGNWQIVPSKVGDAGAGISALDAVYILQALAGSRTLTPEQLMACDTTGNGTLSTLDAVRILQLKAGLITRLDVAQTCNSDWAFIPVPAGQIPPHMTTGSCQAGTIALQSLAGQADNQDFSAVLFGDCTGNWQPAPAASVRSARRQEKRTEGGIAMAVNVGRPEHWGRRIHVPLVVQGGRSFSGLDVEVAYDPARLTFRGVHRAGSASQALLAANERQPGLVAISLASPEPLPVGTVAALLFETRNSHFDSRAIQVLSAQVTDE